MAKGRIVERTNPKWLQILKNVEALKKRPAVKVGVLGKSGLRKDESGLTVAQVATFNEFGTPTTPPRPALRSTLLVRGPQISEIITKIARGLYDGTKFSVRELKLVGEYTAGEVKKRIADSPSWAVPNAPSTVDEKGSATPLIDTGQYRQSITYEVVPSTIGIGAGEVVAGED